VYILLINLLVGGR